MIATPKAGGPSRLRALRARLSPLYAKISPHLGALIVTLGFFASRAFYRLKFDLDFDRGPLAFFLQFADEKLLQTDLLRTTLYLHHQAPLLDLMVGVVLKIAPRMLGPVFDALYLAGGVTLALLLHAALRRLGVRAWLACLVTLAYSMSPTVAFFESWLMYHHPVSVFFILSVAALLRLARKPSTGSVALFFTMLAVLVLTRSVYGTVWLVGCLAVLLVTRPAPRKKLLIGAALPILFVVLYTARVQFLIGRPLGHAMLASNVVQKVVNAMPPKLRDEVRDNEIHPMERLEPFFDLDGHPWRIPQAQTGIPALDETKTSTGGVNSNCLEYVALGDIYEVDAKYLLKKYTRWYLHAVKTALTVGYVMPATTDVWIPRTRPYKVLAPFEKKILNLFVPDKRGRLNVLKIFLPLALAYAVGKLLSVRSALESNRSLNAVLGFVLVSIVYETLATTLVSWSDFSRYRFEIDVLYVLLIGLVLEDGIRLVVWCCAHGKRALFHSSGWLHARRRSRAKFGRAGVSGV